MEQRTKSVRQIEMRSRNRTFSANSSGQLMSCQQSSHWLLNRLLKQIKQSHVVSTDQGNSHRKFFSGVRRKRRYSSHSHPYRKWHLKQLKHSYLRAWPGLQSLSHHSYRPWSACMPGVSQQVSILLPAAPPVCTMFYR